MITTVLAGFLLIVLVAAVVGAVDMIQASSWREVAAERRNAWEARRALTSPARGRRPRPAELIRRRFGGPPAIQP